MLSHIYYNKGAWPHIIIESSLCQRRLTFFLLTTATSAEGASHEREARGRALIVSCEGVHTYNALVKGYIESIFSDIV